MGNESIQIIEIVYLDILYYTRAIKMLTKSNENHILITYSDKSIYKSMIYK